MTTSPTHTLTTGQSYTDSIAGQTISGNGAANETAILQRGASSTTISGVDTIQLVGSVFDYTLSGTGGKIRATSSAYGISLLDTPDSTGTTFKFADGSSATFKYSAVTGYDVHYNVLTLLPNYAVYAPNDSMTINCASNNAVYLSSGEHNITINGNASLVYLTGDTFEQTSWTAGNGYAQFSDSDGMLANVAMAYAHTGTIKFKNASGTLSVDASGHDTFRLGSISLAANETFTTPNSGTSIYGVATDTVVIGSGLSNETLYGIGTVRLSGNSSDYTVKNSGGTLVVDDTAGHTIVSLSSVSSASLSFADGSHPFTKSSSGLSIDGITVSTSVFNPIAGAQTIPSGTNSTGTGTTTLPPSTTSNFHYTISADSSLGSNASAIQADLTKALNDIGKYLNVAGTLDIHLQAQVLGTGILAQASGAMVNTPSAVSSYDHGANVCSEFQAECITGVDANGSLADANVYINTAYLSKMNLSTTSGPSSSQFDLTSILEHEMLHALGFEGYLGTSSSSSYSTAFDKCVQMINGNPYFVGANAEAVYGGAVPLAPASAGQGSAYYHVNVAGDLMNDSIAPGQTKTISALDLAMLKDIGIPEITTVGTQSVVAAHA